MPNKHFDIFETLIAEHQVIREMTAKAQSSPDLASLQASLHSILDFAELHHHFLEEELLFKPAGKNPKIRQGGPYCGYFFDVHIQNDPLKKACNLTHHQLPTNSLDLIPERLRYLFLENNPVKIPIEEHLAGRIILEEAIKIANENSFSIAQPHVQKLLQTYEGVQEIHYKKEETCFFALCRSLFSQDELAAIGLKFAAATAAAK